MLLNLNFKLKDIDGNELETESIAKIVAQALSVKADGMDPIKAMEIAKAKW